jgi:hypothetical protein
MENFDREQIEEMVAIGKAYIPVIEQAIDEAAPVLDKIFTRISYYMREQNVAAIQFYEENGMSHSEAILLVINSNAALQKALENTGKNRK